MVFLKYDMLFFHVSTNRNNAIKLTYLNSFEGIIDT